MTSFLHTRQPKEMSRVEGRSFVGFACVDSQSQVSSGHFGIQTLETNEHYKKMHLNKTLRTIPQSEVFNRRRKLRSQASDDMER